MTVRVCDFVSDCPLDDPVGNFSTEADDTLDYISTFFGGTPPPLLHNWSATECGATFISNISQLDADMMAKAEAWRCVFTNPGDPTRTLFVNNAQSCCVPCPDGTQNCYVVPGGLFLGINQADADALAHNVACALVSTNRVCLGNLSGCLCVGVDYEATIQATAAVHWSLVGGSLPPGLSFEGGFGFSSTITGTPTTNGAYTFRIRGETSAGPYVEKNFTLTVIEITTSALPPFTIGTPYSFQLVASGGSGSYQWTITNGSLPAGLTMSITGLISGTPV